MSPILPAPNLQSDLTKARQQRGEVGAVGDIARELASYLIAFSSEAGTGWREELGHVGLGALLVGSERIEIDELGIVGCRLALVFAAAVDVHQGLYPPCVQIVRMLMPQRDRQQRLRQADHRKRGRPVDLAAFA